MEQEVGIRLPDKSGLDRRPAKEKRSGKRESGIVILTDKTEARQGGPKAKKGKAKEGGEEEVES